MPFNATADNNGADGISQELTLVSRHFIRGRGLNLLREIFRNVGSNDSDRSYLVR